MELETLLLSILPSIFTGMIAFYLQRRQKQRDIRMEERATARKQEGLLALELQMATAKLSYAVAMAVKRGAPNGEVEEGVEAYETAKRKYLQFLNEQAQQYLG